MSPKKVRLVADAIKGLTAEEALVRLQFINKAPAPIISKLVRSALANARHNSNLTDDLMMVKSIIVEEGVPLKRWKPAAFGSAHAFKKRASHVKLILGLKAGAKLPKGVASPAKAEESEKAKTPATAEKAPEAKKEAVKKIARTAKAAKQSEKKKTIKEKE